MHLGAPGAGHGRAGERQAGGAAAETLVGQGNARMLDAVGPREDHRDRHAGRLAGAIADQRGQMHRLAAAIDAAVGVGEAVDGPRLLAALHAAIGQVEGGRRQVEEGVVAVRRLGHQHGRRQPALAALQAGLEAGVAAAVGLGRAQHLVVARQQAHLRVDDRGSGGQRAHEGMHAVVAVDGGQAEVGHDEPLRGRVAARALVFLLGGGVGRQHVDARLQPGDRLGDREGGRHVLVEAGGDGQLPGVDARAAALLQGVQLIGGDLPLEVAALQGLRQVAVADAIDLDAHLLGVDRHQRDALLAAIGQHVAAARHAHRRIAVAHVDGQLRRLQQLLADRRRQPGPHLHLVALAVRQPVEADLPRLGGHRLRVLAVHREILRPVGDARRQPLGELDAQARHRRIGIDLVFEDAEAVLGDQGLQRLAPLGRVDQPEARLRRVDGRPPVGAPLQRLVQHPQRGRLEHRVLRALVGEQRRTRGVHGQIVALGAQLGLDGQQRAGKAQPGVGVVGVRHHRLGIGPRGGPGIGAATQRLVGLGAQLARGLAARLPVGAQVGLVALGVGLDAGVGETLVLRMGEARGQHEREAEEHAESDRHGGDLRVRMAQIRLFRAPRPVEREWISDQ